MIRKTLQILSSDIEAIAQATAEKIYEMDDKLLTLPQMAQKMNKSEEAVKKLVQRGKLPHRRLGKTLYFSDKETTKYLLSIH